MYEAKAALAARDRRRMAIIVGSIPAPSETHLIREIDELDRLGWDITLFLTPCAGAALLSDDERWGARLERAVTPSPHVRVGALLWWLRHDPRRILMLYAVVLGSQIRRPQRLLSSIATIHHAFYWARHMHGAGVTPLHAHGAGEAGLAAWIVSQLTGAAYSISAFGRDVDGDDKMLQRKMHGAFAITAASRMLRDEHLAGLLSLRDLARVSIVPPGIVAAAYTARKDRQRERGRTITLLTVAPLVEGSGLTTLIDACADLTARGYYMQCQIIGDGPAWSTLWTRISGAGLQGSIILAGVQPRSEIRRALQGASFYVQPTTTSRGAADDVPTALIEAMALGVPVLATRAGVHSEYVVDGETGLLTPPHASSALADAIASLERDESRARTLAEAARARVVESNDLRGVMLLFHTLLVEKQGSLAPEPATIPRGVEALSVTRR